MFHALYRTLDGIGRHWEEAQGFIKQCKMFFQPGVFQMVEKGYSIDIDNGRFDQNLSKNGLKPAKFDQILTKTAV